MAGLALLAMAALARLPRQSAFARGLPNDADFFPIAVWLQDPSQAPRYKAAGFNLYVGLWQGPTESQLRSLKSAGMPVICEQNAVGLAHRDDSTIAGWMHGDEPDNAQEVKDPVTGKAGYGPCIPPPKVVDEYRRMHTADPTRPIMLNLGQGVANDDWLGRGNGASLKDYETYVKGGDIVSFDVYPVAGLPKPDPENYLWYVPKGVDRLTKWVTDGGIPGAHVWNCIECTRIDGDRKATPAQVESEVWMSLIHGSRGLIYFVHQFKPAFDERALLDDPEMLSHVTALNRRIQSLAPMLNGPSLSGIATVKSSNDAVTVDTMVKRWNGALYIFAVGMRNAPTTAPFFLLTGLPKRAHIVVDGENRSIELRNGAFTDAFGSYEFHLYRVALT